MQLYNIEGKGGNACGRGMSSVLAKSANSYTLSAGNN